MTSDPALPLRSVRCTPIAADGTQNGPTCTILTAVPVVVFVAPDPGPDDELFCFATPQEWCLTLTGVDPELVRIVFDIPPKFPLWYRRPRAALPAPPPRLALPWGDSAYTSCVYEQWLSGDPHPAPGWCQGPPPPLTPSWEGPRRQHHVLAGHAAPSADLLRRVLDGLRKF